LVSTAWGRQPRMSRVLRRKVLVVGDPAVGKSALVSMLTSAGQSFPKQYSMTCGVEFKVKMVSVPGASDTVELHLFDLGGQDVFVEQGRKFWEGASAVVLVYDVTRQHTLEACGGRYQALLEALAVNGLPGVLVANKADLQERLVVPRSAGMHLAEQLGMPYYETSAAEGDGILPPFEAVATELLKQATETGDFETGY